MTAEAPQAVDERRVGAREAIAFTVMCIGMYMALINIQIVGSSFAQIQGGIGATADQISWVLTSALIAEVIMIPLSGWLSRLLSTRILFATCVSVFTLASIGCASADQVETMILFRALQGFSGGALMPVVFATVYTIFPRRLQNFVMTVVAICGTSSLAVGPTLGGWITDELSWRWMFLVNVPLGVLVVIGVLWFVDFDKAEKQLLKQIDFLGIGLAAIFLSCTLVVLEEGQSEDWLDSSMIVGLAAVAILGGYLFLWRELTARHPVVDLRAFGNRNFALGCFYIATFGATLYVPIFTLPLFLAQIRDISSIQIGTIVSVLGVTMIFSGFLAGLMLRFLRRRTVAAIGFSVLAYGTYLQSNLTNEYGFAELVLPQMVRGLASQMCWLSIATLALDGVPVEKVRNASALFNLMMRLGGATSVALANTAIQILSHHHYARIAETVVLGQAEALRALPRFAGLFQSLYGDSPTATAAGQAMLVELARRESLIRAFNDVTFAAAAMCAMSLLLLPLIRGRRPLFAAADKS